MDRPAATYRVVASSIESFVQQVAVSYLSNGYFFFVQGWIPEGKDPKALDEKLLGKYGIAISKWSRARRKQAGLANMQYIRLGRLFLLMATHGKHKFFEEEKGTIKDARRTPIRAFGYAISHRSGHSHVRIDLNDYKRLRAHFLGLAKHREASTIEHEFFSVPFEPYAPVRRQLINIWRAVNRLRKESGFAPIRINGIRLKRTQRRVLE